MRETNEAAALRREFERFVPAATLHMEQNVATSMVRFRVTVALPEPEMEVSYEALVSGQINIGRIGGLLGTQLQEAAIAGLGIERIITKRLAAEVAKRLALADEFEAVRVHLREDAAAMLDDRPERMHILGQIAALGRAADALRRA